MRKLEATIRSIRFDDQVMAALKRLAKLHGSYNRGLRVVLLGAGVGKVTTKPKEKR